MSLDQKLKPGVPRRWLLAIAAAFIINKLLLSQLKLQKAIVYGRNCF